MRKFRFVGDPEPYKSSETDPFKVGEDYDYDFKGFGCSYTVLEYSKMRFASTDWQEVFEEDSVSIEDMNKAYNEVIGFNPKPLHKDTDLGYYAGLAMQGILAQNDLLPEIVAEHSIACAKELIKQLNEETK